MTNLLRSASPAFPHAAWHDPTLTLCYNCTTFQWCETQRDCNRLRLLDILVRPMQRLTKYSLLLRAILKKTEEDRARSNLILMDERVYAFVSDVNSHLRQRQEHERLKTIIARIESYEPVVSYSTTVQCVLATEN